MNWREQIEAQIHWLYRSDCMDGDDFLDAVEQGQLQKASEQMQALLDVAVAAEDLLTRGGYMHGSDAHTNVADALDKLREVGDE